MGWLMKKASILITAAFIGSTGASFAQMPAGSAESPEDYPDRPGRDATFYSCSACHGFKIVAAQALGREQWDGVLDLMNQRHSMPRIEGTARSLVLDYLAAAFPPRFSPPGRGSPFAPK